VGDIFELSDLPATEMVFFYDLESESLLNEMLEFELMVLQVLVVEMPKRQPRDAPQESAFE
jgi:hypothetical protein